MMDRPPRQWPRADLAWTALVLLLVVASATLLALASCGLFHWARAAAIALPLTGALLWRCQRRGTLLEAGGAWRFLPVALLAAPLYAHPHEYLNDWDPGIYLSAGSLIAGTGQLVHRETPDWQQLSPAEQRIFFAYHRTTRYSGFPGGEAPNFLHLYPAWIALFVQIAGPGAGLWVNPAFGLLLPLLVFSLAFALTRERSIAWLAALLLLLNVNHLYFARFSTAEMVGAVVLAAAALALLHGWRRRAPFWLVLGAAAFALAACAKIDLYPFLVLLLGCLALFAAVRPDPRLRWLGCGGAASLALLLAYYRLEAWDYVARTFRLFGVGAGAVAAASGLVAAASLFALFAVRPSFGAALSGRLRRLDALVRTHRRASLTFALIAAAGAALYRARVAGQPHIWDRMAIVIWIFTPAGVLLLAAGCLLWLRRDAPGAAARAGLVAATGVALIVTFSDPVWGREPLHFWISRRLELVLLPLFCLFIATALSRLGAAFRWGRVIAAGLLLLIVGTPLYGAAPWLGKADQAGLYALCGRLAAQVKPGDLVVCDQGWLSAPLHFVWGVDTLALQLDRDAAAALAVVDRWESHGRRVFYLTTSAAVVFHPERDFALRFSQDFVLDSLDRPLARLPDSRVTKPLVVRLYQILPAPPAPAAHGAPIRISIGDNLFGLGEGFEPPRYFTVGGLTPDGKRDPAPDALRRVFARRCRERCVVHLPLPPADGARWRVRLRLDDVRRQPRGALELSLFLDGADLGTRALTAGAQDLEFDLPAMTAAPGPARGVGRLALAVRAHDLPGASPESAATVVVESVLLHPREDAPE
jgi:hypothetical protein